MENIYEKYLQAVEKHRDLIFAAEEYLWKHPELGFKEWKSQAYLAEQFQKLGYELTFAGDIPGFYTDLDTGRPGPTVLLMAELDALCVESHPDADKETHAVHACGHCGQCASLLGAAAALKEPGALDGMWGKIRLMCVPAEELIEVEYREELRKKGIISFYSGKQEFIARGYMEDVDLVTLSHATTGDFGKGKVSVGQNGFIINNCTFHGKSTHAGSNPHSGINALYAANVALNACNALRETFREEDHIRFHPIITKGGSVVNAIPETVKIESYIRGATVEAIGEVNKKINRALGGAALSMGANVTLCNRPGYLPVRSDKNASSVAKEALGLIFGEENAEISQKWGNGSTDMGDMTCLFPTAYVHVSGAVGKGHSNNYYIADAESFCVGSAKYLCLFARLLLENEAARGKKAIAEFTPSFADKKTYLAAMNAMTLDREAVTYNEDGTASVYTG